MPINRAPFNALVDDDGSNTVGTVWNKTQIKNVLLDPMDAFVSNGGVWTPYVPGWAGADGFGPGIGNGVLSGRYVRIGQWVDVAIVLTMGSTTTYGTSSYWTFSLPFAPFVGAGAPYQSITFRGGAMTAAGSVQPSLVAYAIGSTCYVVTASGGLVNPTTPFTWATGATLSIRGSYEVP